MQRFDIYRHPTLGAKAVKDGFSWPALFFGWLWALFKKLWVAAVVLFIVHSIVISLYESTDSPPALILIFLFCWLPVFLVPGLYGNQWVKNNLASRGYENT